jgi:hypothetical protein
MAAAANKVTGNDIASIRERTAVAFEELAKIANSGVQEQRPAQTQIKNAPPPPRPPAATLASPEEYDDVPETAYTAPELIDRSYSPMAAFGLKKQSAARGGQSTSRQMTSNAGPPKKLVYFEKEGIGTVPAFFHDVVIDVTQDETDAFAESGFIVLVYDLRFEQAAARWFPPADDPYKRPWAIQINNDRRLYLVHTTGFQYVYDEREFCVLLVEKAVTGE